MVSDTNQIGDRSSSDTNVLFRLAKLYNLGMAKKDQPSALAMRLTAARKVAGELSQTALAKKMGLTRSAVSQWESDTTSPTSDNLRQIAVICDVDYDWLATGRGVARPEHDLRSEDVAAALPEPPRPRNVPVKGYVGAGSEAHYYKLADDDEYEEVDPPPNGTDRTVAVEIRGKSMGPALEGWLVFYDDVRSPITDDMFNRLCVVGLADDRILIKIVKRERTGSITLLSNGHDDPIPDAQIEWAALVTDLRRRG